MAMLMQRWGVTATRLLVTSVGEQRYSFTSGAAPVLCGRGDKRTKKGKVFKGSFGNSRPKKDKNIRKDKLELPRSTPWPLPFKLI